MQEGSKLTIPIAIIVAGVLIAGAILLVSGGGIPSVGNAPQGEQNTGATNIPAVSSADHILGNPDAPILIVEYSDFECPFCKTFHPTMQRVIEEYGKNGQVAWVLRQFPIVQLHSKAPKEAEASECAAELGGNSAFWAFADRIFEITPSNNGLDLSLLPQIAVDVGLNRAAFETCLNSGRYSQKVQTQVDEAIAAGARGTPHSVIIFGETRIEIPGAQPYTAVKSVIDSLLAQKQTGNPGTQAVPIITP